MVRRVAITGAGGMLGHDLIRALEGREVAAFDHASCDITDSASTHARIAEARPEVVVHLAAYTKVNACERDPIRAFLVNGEGTRNVARGANAAGARLVYISTDYVFNGRKHTPWTEDDPVDPINVYGRSKLEGERQASREATLIVRSGWLYGSHGRNFVEAILEQAAKGGPLKVVADQMGCPTYTPHLAAAIVALMDREARGIVHVPAGGECTWHEFALAILEAKGYSLPVEAASSESDPTPRPEYSVLSDERLRGLGVSPLPHWREGLREYLAHRA